jgi:hypothetical protein
MWFFTRCTRLFCDISIIGGIKFFSDWLRLQTCVSWDFRGCWEIWGRVYCLTHIFGIIFRACKFIIIFLILINFDLLMNFTIIFLRSIYLPQPTITFMQKSSILIRIMRLFAWISWIFLGLIFLSIVFYNSIRSLYFIRCMIRIIFSSIIIEIIYLKILIIIIIFMFMLFIFLIRFRKISMIIKSCQFLLL